MNPQEEQADQEINISPDAIIEVRPGEKWIITFPDYLTESERAQIGHQIQKWWNGPASSFLLFSGGFKLIKLADENPSASVE